jgi:hypothetical protein
MERAMKKPTGVIIAAVLLLLLAIVGTIFTIATALVAAIMPHPALSGRQSQIVEGILVALIALPTTFTWFVGVGLLRGKNWARIGGVVLGGLMALLFAFFAFGITAMMMAPQFRLQFANTRFGLVTGVVFYLLLAAFGLWLVIYLSLKPVRQAFHPDPAYVPTSVAYPSNAALDAATVSAFPASGPYSETSSASAQFNPGLKLPRIVVLVLAALNLVGSLSLLTMAAARFPLVFPGISLQGHAAALAMVVIEAINVVIAIGLFRRFPPAYYVALAMQALGVVSSLALLSPSFRARTIQASMVIAARMTPVQPPQMQSAQMQSAQMQSAQMQSAQMQSMMHSIQNGALLFNAIFVPFLLAFFIWAILRDLASVRGNTAAR